jgi:type I restriction enzyme, S subunit
VKVFSLEGLPANWKVEKLGSVVEFVGGSQPPKETFQSEPFEGCVRLVQIRDFRTDKFPTFIPKNLARRHFDETDVMIGRYGPPVFQILRGLSGSYNVALMKAVPKSAISKDYLYHLLQEPRLHHHVVANSERTAGQSGVNLTLLEAIRIPLPPFAEQRRIAEVLDRAKALRAKRRVGLAQLDSLTQSLFLDVFGDPATNEQGWPVSRIGDLGEIGTGSTPSRRIERNFGGDTPWVKTTEVDWGFITDTEEKITKRGLDSSRCKVYPVGSIVVALYGQGKTRGKAAVLAIEAATNQACGVLQPNEKYETPFLFQQLRLSYQRLRDLGRGGNQENLNLGLLSNFTVLLPPLKLQREFGRRVAAVEKLKTAQHASLVELDALFASLQYRAFRGEL